MQFLTVALALSASVQAVPIWIKRADLNTTLVNAEDGAQDTVESTAKLINGRADVASTLNNTLQGTQSSVQSVADLVNTRRADNSVSSTVSEASAR